MRYRVVFSKRYQSDGQESSIDPTAELDVYLADGVVAEKNFVERLEPAAQHSQEALDEDDAFLAASTPESWEYEVVDSRVDEFMDAVKKSQVILEVALIDESETVQDDATAVALAEGDSRTPDELNDADDTAGRAGSGVRATMGDGPAGNPTGDPSAGGMPDARSYLGNEELEGIAEAGSGGLDELTIVDADDPSLGLTEPGERGADWAANTGPTRAPGRGISTRDLTDRSSTLRQPPSPEDSPSEEPKKRKTATKAKARKPAGAKKSG